jgi:hypothetical protein
VACVYGRNVSNSGRMPKWPELFRLEEKASKRSLDLNGETGLSTGNRRCQIVFFWTFLLGLPPEQTAVIFFVRKGLVGSDVSNGEHS